jgi:predicted dinucleotide-binding enzyme
MVQQLSKTAPRGTTVRVIRLGDPIPDPVVFNTISYANALDVLKGYAAQLDGKVLVDISDPANPTFAELPTPPGTSAAEEIAKVVPQTTHVVKAFNTTFASSLSLGQPGEHPLDVFIAGDDDQAKATVARLIEQGGLRAIDAGPLH